MTICRLFHGTDAAFDRFDLCFAVQEDRHENGALGIWFETREVIAAHFGRHLITVDVDVSRWYEMTISELTRHALRSESAAFYAQLRDQLKAQGYQAICLVELSGESFQRIILDPSVITILSQTESSIHEPLA